MAIAADFESGTSGATISTGDAGSTDAWDAVSVGANTTVTYDTAHVAHGSLAAKFAASASAGVSYLAWSTKFGTKTDHYGRMYIYFAAWPNAGTTPRLMQCLNGASSVARLQLQAAASPHLVLVNATGAAVGTSSTVLATNTLYRIEWHFTHNTSTGVLEIKLFAGDSTSALETLTSSATNTGAQATEVRIGFPDVAPVATTYWLDDVAAAATSYPGPAGVSAPTNSVAPAVTGTLKVGQTLSTDNGTWTGSPTGYTYKWQRSSDGSTGWADIGSATSSTYTLTSSDDAKYVRSVVTATNAGGSTSANSAATGQIHTSYTGSSTTAITDTITTAGRRRRHGATTTSLTDSITTAGVRRRHGVSTTAITDTITTASKIKRHGSTTTSLADAIATAGKLRMRSSSTTPLSLSVTTTGRPRLHGSSTTPLVFSVATSATRRTHTSTTFGITDSIATTGRLRAYSSSTLPISFIVFTVAGGTTGQATFSITSGISTAGKVRAHSSTTLPAHISITTSATRSTYGTSTLSETLSIITAATAGRHGTVEFDEHILITTIVGGQLILGAMIQGELSFTSIGMIAPNQTGDIDYR